MSKPILSALTILPLALVLICNRAGGATPKLEKVVCPDSGAVLYKPARWKVQEELDESSLHITVSSPDEPSAVDLLFAADERIKVDALILMREQAQRLASRHSDLTILEAYEADDGERGVLSYRFEERGRPVVGRCYIDYDGDAKRFSVQGYRAPESKIVSRRPLLVDMLSNLRFADGGDVGACGSASLPDPVPVSVVRRRAADGSMEMKTPADWHFQAQGGRVITGSPNGDAGFVFTSLEVLPNGYGVPVGPTVLVSPYRSPAQFLPAVLQHFENRNVKVHESTPDHETMQAFPTYVGRGCEAADMVVSWTSPQGARCLGAFKMINATPSMMGMWFTIVAGFWAPEADFYRYYPLLEAVGSSFAVDDRYAADYVRKGLARAKELQGKTAAAVAELNQSRHENQAAWERRQDRGDFMASKWDDYRRGHSYWVSEIEGGKVYATDTWETRDTWTGDTFEDRPYEYVHFEGQNPRHPSESMREVSSWELEQMNARR